MPYCVIRPSPISKSFAPIDSLNPNQIVGPHVHCVNHPWGRGLAVIDS